jgi:mRNA interferase MazF
VVRVRASAYVPDRGDIVWIDFSPHAGHEQAGTRPGLVISSAGYNGRAGLALVCPITNQAKGYWFEVALPKAIQVTGVVLADQMRNVDWRVRRARKIARAPLAVVSDVLERLDTLLRPTA